ncbi:hypothetical protein DXG01_005964 [Tephrocybe rancida]|nr:hypothetical protein DXG01_005964 [Tephrocybe rancida]
MYAPAVLKRGPLPLPAAILPTPLPVIHSRVVKFEYMIGQPATTGAEQWLSMLNPQRLQRLTNFFQEVSGKLLPDTLELLHLCCSALGTDDVKTQVEVFVQNVLDQCPDIRCICLTDPLRFTYFYKKGNGARKHTGIHQFNRQVFYFISTLPELIPILMQ